MRQAERDRSCQMNYKAAFPNGSALFVTSEEMDYVDLGSVQWQQR